MTQDICPQGHSRQTISAWQLRLLPPAEHAVISEHIAHCAICQQRVTEYNQLDSIIKEKPYLIPQHEIWQNVRSLLTSSQAPTITMKRRQMLSIGSAFLVVALIATAIFFVLHHGSNSTIDPLSTPIAGKDGASLTYPSGIDHLAFAPSAPRTGYATTLDKNRNFSIYVTHNGGRTWQPITTSLPSNPPYFFTGSLSINPSDPLDLVLIQFQYFTQNDGSYKQIDTTYRSLDGGQHWIKLTFDTNNTTWVKFPLTAWIQHTLYLCDRNTLTGIFANTPGSNEVNEIDDQSLMKPRAAQNGQIADMYTYQGALYVAIHVKLPQKALIIANTSNNGTTWNMIQPNTSDLLDIAGAGVSSITTLHLFPNAPLIGRPWSNFDGSPTRDQQRYFLESFDGGKTWTTITLPDGFVLNTTNTTGTVESVVVISAPDRSLIAFDDAHIWEMLAGTTTWQQRDRYEGWSSLESDEITVSTDVNGHPLLVWITSREVGTEPRYYPLLP